MEAHSPLSTQDTSVLLYLNAALASTRTQEEFFAILVEKLRLLFPFDRLSITTSGNADTFKRVFLSDDVATLHLPVFDSLKPIVEKFTQEFKDIQAPQTFRLADLAQRYPSSEMLARHGQHGVAFVTLVPLWMRSTQVGMLSITTQKDSAFAPDDLALLAQIGNLVAISLSNAQAFEELTQHAREKTAQLTVTNALLGSKNQTELFLTVATELNRVVPFERLLLWLQQPTGQTQSFAELLKQADGRFLPLTEAYWEDRFADQSQRNQAFDLFGNEAALYQGTAAYPAPRQYLQHPDPQATYFVLGVPLRLPDGVTGVLMLTSQPPQGFTPADLAVVRGLVPQITLGIQNLFAFERIEELRAQLEQEKTYLMDEINTTARFEDFVGQSAMMQQLQQRIRQVAPTDTTVLISGETGTGKELVARAVHNLSPRKERALIKLNCAALPAQLIESELFGHEKGAFTGAHDRRIGKFELADGGTIFLDEVGELPLELQAKLLRVLQEKEFERIGGRRVIHTNVRVIAATNRVLEDQVAAGLFRADLYYRLNVFSLKVPALRERPDDVEPLLRHYLERFTKRMGKPVRGLRERDVRTLQAYPWPGNVRELEHVVEQAVIISQGPFLELSVATVGQQPPTALVPPEIRPLQEVERDYILAALQQTGGRVSGPYGAAALLGLKPTTLDARMKKLGLQRTVVKSL